MRALQIDKTHSDIKEAVHSLHVVEKEIPSPGPGEVLVRIEAAPCNPSDLLFLQGKYGVKKTMPAVPGWEGAGTVVKAGRGILPWWLNGKRVACGGQKDTDGTWAEYYLTKANACIPLRSDLPIEQGATLIVNPLTAVGLLEKGKEEKARALVQTAAASQVGRMLNYLAKEAGIPLINIVRRDEQVEFLKGEGAEIVLNSSDKDFRKILEEKTEELKATVAIDAVAGEMTGLLAEALPDKSKVFVYGALSEKACSGISPLSLIFEEKKVEGFWLRKWIEEAGFFGIMRASKKIQCVIAEGKFKTVIQKKVTLEEAPDALITYHEKMTEGKVILSP